MFNLSKIRNIQPVLTRKACETLVMGLVMSHLDYCNGILINISECYLKQFQRIQSAAAKLVLLRTKFDSVRDALQQLGWLPIQDRVKFKLLMLMHKITHGNAPQYLSNLVILKSKTRTLRSQFENYIYIVPRVKFKTFAAHSFSAQVPSLWNVLPAELREETNFDTFKIKLKTHLFINSNY